MKKFFCFDWSFILELPQSTKYMKNIPERRPSIGSSDITTVSSSFITDIKDDESCKFYIKTKILIWNFSFI